MSIEAGENRHYNHTIDCSEREQIKQTDKTDKKFIIYTKATAI
jgi:hypothetical protein